MYTLGIYIQQPEQCGLSVRVLSLMSIDAGSRCQPKAVNVYLIIPIRIIN